MILKLSPTDQNADNFFKVSDLEDPCCENTAGEVTIYMYSVALNTGTVGTVSSIRITERGGLEVEHALPATYDVTTETGRTAAIAAINALLKSLGYDEGVGSSWSDPTFTIYTDFSEIVFNGVNGSGNAFVQGSSTKVGYA